MNDGNTPLNPRPTRARSENVCEGITVDIVLVIFVHGNGRSKAPRVSIASTTLAEAEHRFRFLSGMFGEIEFKQRIVEIKREIVSSCSENLEILVEVSCNKILAWMYSGDQKKVWNYAWLRNPLIFILGTP